MMSTSKQFATLLLALGLAGGAAVCRAQDPQSQEPGQDQQAPDSNRPKPAARSLPGMINDQNTDQGSNDQWQADTSPVTGLISPTLGAPTLRHSYWALGAQYGLMAQSTPFTGSGSSDSWATTHFMGGTASLVKAWSRSTLDLNYSGGGVITTMPGEENGTYQQVAASQNFQLGRWQWQFTDQFAYLPQSQFGFGVGTGLAVPGIGGSLGPNTGGALPPNQSIFSATGPRYSNMVIAQGTYEFTRRSSFTIAGMDSILHFTQAQNVDNQNYLGSAGYNYQLTKLDSIGLMYRFSSYHFPGQPEAYGDTSVSVAYQRKMTQKMALSAYGGPDFISSRLPLNGPGSSDSETLFQGSVGLTYAFKVASVNANYYHGLTAGSGVLLGGKVDQVSLAAQRQLTRMWSGNVNGGYARNRQLTTGGTAGFSGYDNYFVGAGAARPFGRNVDFNIAYTAYFERTSGACTGVNCGANTTQHTITVFLNWHTRPFVIE